MTAGRGPTDLQSLGQDGAPRAGHPARQPGPTLCPDAVGQARRGLQRGRAERAAPSPGPLAPSFPTTRPLPTPLPQLRLPPSNPPPADTTDRDALLPPANPTNFPVPPLSLPPLRSTQKLQARRLLRTAPIFPSRVRFSHRRGAARIGGGEEPGRPPQRQVCTLMLPSFPEREERKGGPVKAPRAPPPPPPSLPRRAALSSRDASACFHPAASSPGAPLPPRSSSFSLFLSRSGAGIRLPPSRIAAEVSLRAGEPSPPSAPPPGQVRKGKEAVRTASARRPREICGASRGGLEGKGRPAAHSEGILSRAGPFSPPRGGREATLNNIGSRRGRDYFLRLGPAAACAALCAAAAGRARWGSGSTPAATWAGAGAAGDGWLGLQSCRSTLRDSPRSRYEA